MQIAGTDAAMMAEAAAYNVDRGAQIIDINMGCPAKKVCNQWAGSALMKDEPLALAIVEAVVAACAPHGVPVTLKMRTGWCASEKNAVRIARAAEGAGIAMVAVHGRTREQGYKGDAEYDTVAAVKRARRASRSSPTATSIRRQKAREVFAATGADAIMIGRAAQGRPWIFARDRALPRHRRARPRRRASPTSRRWLLEHLDDHYASLRRIRRRAQRPQAHRLDLARPARRRGVPRRDERDRIVRRAGRAPSAPGSTALADDTPLHAARAERTTDAGRAPLTRDDAR